MLHLPLEGQQVLLAMVDCGSVVAEGRCQLQEARPQTCKPSCARLQTSHKLLQTTTHLIYPVAWYTRKKVRLNDRGR